uniref:Cyclin n=1 Tax=Picea sitchensis TaxID=3332 RepID=A9NP68_PICSI|nr:unknown [Picea sitchensis]
MQSGIRRERPATEDGGLGVEEEEEGYECPPESQLPRILAVLSYALQRLVTRNDQCALPADGKKITVFHGVRSPSITVAKYLERIYKYTSCSPSCFVVGYVYIDRLVHRQPDFPVISLNIHRLLLTSVMIAAKMLDDAHYNNAFYARVGGISNTELNRLEIDFLFRLGFRLKVTGKVFESYCLHLEKEMLLGTAGQRIERTLPEFHRVSLESDSAKREESKVPRCSSATAMVVGHHPDPPSR